MLNDRDTKRERIHLRLDAASKRTLERAAAYTHRSVSEFVLSHALEAAHEVLEVHEKNVLSPADWAAFMEALDQPPPPNKALKDLFRRPNDQGSG